MNLFFILVGIVFFTYSTICGIVFLEIAVKWPRLIKIWIHKEHEAGLLKHPYKIHGWRLATKLRCTAMTVIFLAFGMFNEKKDTRKKLYIIYESKSYKLNLFSSRARPFLIEFYIQSVSGSNGV